MSRKTKVIAGTGVVFFLASAFIQTYSLPKSVERGKELYTLYCQNCHMADGKGQAGVFPPLAKSDYLKRPSNMLLDVILKGQGGLITVNGEKYNGQMPAQGYLTNEQIADILNYARNSWGNKTTIAIMPAQVAKGRP